VRIGNGYCVSKSARPARNAPASGARKSRAWSNEPRARPSHVLTGRSCSGRNDMGDDASNRGPPQCVEGNRHSGSAARQWRALRSRRCHSVRARRFEARSRSARRGTFGFFNISQVRPVGPPGRSKVAIMPQQGGGGYAVGEGIAQEPAQCFSVSADSRFRMDAIRQGQFLRN